AAIRYHAGMALFAPPPPPSPTGLPGSPAGDPLVVETAGLRDLPALAQLQRRAFPPRLAYTLSTLVLLRLIPWVRILLVRRNGEVAGCVIGDRVIEGGRVVNQAVDPAYQRQGIGRALLAEVEVALRTPAMMLMVQAENASARALYLSAGYREDATLPHYYGPDRPGIRMMKGGAAPADA
ncbi:MAG: GNAT family N-acetyltransferase, partial [Thermomicrobiales bacterium]